MNELATADAPPMMYEGGATGTAALVLDGSSMERMMSIAEKMASAKVTIPKHLANSAGDCLAVVMQAVQWRMNPFAVAQKTHLVNGALGYEAQLVNAVVQASGAITGRFHYEYRGEGNALECRVGAVPRGESEIVWNEWLKSSDVAVKNSPLWKTNPKQQMGYLQVKNWARAYTPGAIMGVYTPDELETIPASERERDITGEGQVVGRGEETKPAYPDDKFKENMPTWKKYVDAVRKTPDDIIATVETLNTLSAEQKAEIKKLGDKPTDPEPKNFGATFAEVEEKLRKADSIDAVAEAADLINSVDPKFKDQLTALYNERVAALGS